MSSETLRGEGKELLGPDSKAKRLTDIDLDSSNIVTTTAQRQCTVQQPRLKRPLRLNGLRENLDKTRNLFRVPIGTLRFSAQNTILKAQNARNTNTEVPVQSILPIKCEVAKF